VLEPLPAFLLKIASVTARSGERDGMTYIIIRRPYGYLEDEVRRVFTGRKDVRIVVDRRSSERRTTQQPVMVDRRRADRRKVKEELVEVLVVEGTAGPSA